MGAQENPQESSGLLKRNAGTRVLTFCFLFLRPLVPGLFFFCVSGSDMIPFAEEGLGIFYRFRIQRDDPLILTVLHRDSNRGCDNPD